MTSTSSTKSILPPYISVAKLKELFLLISTRSFNQITKEDLTARGFSQIDALLALSSLRFLGLINEENRVSESMSPLRLIGDDQKKALQTVVKNGYHELFNIVPNANNLNRVELFNEFMGVYKLSPRVAKAAVPDFLWLCSEAGLEVQKIVEARAPQARQRKKKVNAPEQTQEGLTKPLPNASREFVLPFGPLKLIVPDTEKAREALIAGRFQEIADKLKTLADLLEPKPNKSESEEVSDGDNAGGADRGDQ